MSRAIYDRITTLIVARLEAGTVPWHQPWNATTEGELHNLFTGHVYQGINVLVLGMQPYDRPYWCTFLQAQAHGGSVRKGEHGTPILKVGGSRRAGEDGEEHLGRFLKLYTVFNIAQLDGIAAPARPPLEPLAFEPLARCEQLVAAIPAPPVIRHGAHAAYYQPRPDVLRMPDPERFESAEAYYATLFHELTHSTGHEARLNRPTLAEAGRFGSTNYSKEELVAEMGAGFLCGLCGIENRTVDNSAAYLQGWLRRLRQDQTLLVAAAAQAQRAANWLTQRRDARGAGQQSAPQEQEESR